MITALFIYDSKGDVLMSKLYKDGIKRNISDVFRIQIISTTNKGASSSSRDVRSPVLTLGSTSFVYIKSSLIWFCAVTRSNQDCSAILEFLYNLESLLKVVVNGGDGSSGLRKQLTSELITNNFSLVYELLEEIVEFGYPTNLELSYLKNYLTTVPTNDNIFKMSSSAWKSSKNAGASNTVNASSSSRAHPDRNITWRSPGIKYRRNEIFLNVEEKITVVMNDDADVLRSHVDGCIRMKTHLSGMPECRFGLGDNSILLNSFNKNVDTSGGNVILEDSKFHQCVELNKFDSDRLIQFVPPDGEFQLMAYHCRLNINLPFKVYADVYEIGRLKLLYKIRVKSCFPAKIPATNVQIKVPTPKGVLDSYSSNSAGKSKFHPEDNVILWKFNKFFGEQEHVLTAEVELADNSHDTSQQMAQTNTTNSILNWSRPPIKLDFVIEMFSSSGLAVKFLKVQEKSNYKTVKWVKYSTQSGSYEIRY